jgi:hypothetical protein
MKSRRPDASANLVDQGLRAHRREPAIDELPVDLLRQQHQRVLQVDDLIELWPQQIRLPIVTRSCHHPPPRIAVDDTGESNH